MKSIFELASNLTLVLIKLDTELGLAQPQLVVVYFDSADYCLLVSELPCTTNLKVEIILESVIN